MGVISAALLVLFLAILYAAAQASGGFWNLLGIVGVVIGVMIGGILLLSAISDLKKSIKIHKQKKERKEAQKKFEEEMKKIHEESQRALEEARRKQEEDQRKREIQKKECPQKLREMTEYYIHSDLVHEILLELCQGDLSNRPIEIEVWPHMITAKKSEHEKYFYRFSEHRVPDLKEVAEETVEASPIIALAHAINYLLDDDYICHDSPIISKLELKRINTF